jgi:predicted nucleic-acid-binding Zn-ribbon protein
LLFPSIIEISFEGNLLTIDGIQHIATSCNNLKYIEFYQCNSIDIQNAIRLFNTDQHKENLERIFIHSNCSSRTNQVKFPKENDFLFMSRCGRCGLFFNKLKNEKQMLCLYHPGVSIQLRTLKQKYTFCYQ